MVIDAPPRIAPSEQRQEAIAEGPLVFRRMSYEEYMRLPEKPKNEWVDGVAVIHMPPPSQLHWISAALIAQTIAAALPSLIVGQEGGLYLTNQVFVPDIIAFDRAEKMSDKMPGRPIFVVEVLSPSTQKYDLTTKLDAYLKASISQYWTVDTVAEEIVIRENAGTDWVEVSRLDAAHPKVAVAVGEYGTVTLERDSLFG